MFYGHAIFIGGNSQKESRYLSFLPGLSLSHPVDTKTDFNFNNIIATLSLISISLVKQFAGKCPDTYSNLISTPLDEFYAALTSQSLRATIGPLQDNWSLFHYVIGILGILPYNRNVTLQTLELFSVYARLYNAAASPASRLRSAGSLAIINHKGTSLGWLRMEKIDKDYKQWNWKI